MNVKNSLLLIFKNINTFQNNLKNQIDNVLFKPIECYLLESNWKSNLLIHSNNNSYKNFNKSLNQEINQSFIDNFSMAIKFLANDGQISYVSKNLMESFFNKKELNQLHNISQIYAANKKIIIDFQGNDLNKSILIISPIENENKKIIFIVVFKNNYKNKNEIFKSLLSENINNQADIDKLKEKYLDFLINFEDFINNEDDDEKNSIKLSSIIINENNEKEIKEILQILILFYYYEKYLSKINNIFSEYQNYYLINQDWIDIYKEYYYYNDLFHLLKEYDKNHYDINYLKIDNNLKGIINLFYDNFRKFKIQIGIPEYLKNIDSLKASLLKSKNLKYFK